MKVFKNKSLEAIKGGQIKEIYYYSERRFDGIKLYSIIFVDYDKEQKDPWLFIMARYHPEVFSPQIKVIKGSSRESFQDEGFFKNLGYKKLL